MSFACSSVSSCSTPVRCDAKLACVRVGRYSDAIRCFRAALEANPSLHRTRVELLHAMSAVADWRGYSDSMHHVRTITQQQLNNDEFTFLQPFDALAHPIPNDMLRYNLKSA